MKRFIFSAEARRDLHNIGAYIGRDSRTAAKRVVGEIRAAVSKLASTPGLGHARPDLTDKPYLFWTVYSYQIVYRPLPKPMTVMRILHGARDVQRIL